MFLVAVLDIRNDCFVKFVSKVAENKKCPKEDPTQYRRPYLTKKQSSCKQDNSYCIGKQKIYLYK
jgi:hypothetical protein